MSIQGRCTSCGTVWDFANTQALFTATTCFCKGEIKPLARRRSRTLPDGRTLGQALRTEEKS